MTEFRSWHDCSSAPSRRKDAVSRGGRSTRKGLSAAPFMSGAGRSQPAPSATRHSGRRGHAPSGRRRGRNQGSGSRSAEGESGAPNGIRMTVRHACRRGPTCTEVHPQAWGCTARNEARWRDVGGAVRLAAPSDETDYRQIGLFNFRRTQPAVASRACRRGVNMHRDPTTGGRDARHGMRHVVRNLGGSLNSSDLGIGGHALVRVSPLLRRSRPPPWLDAPAVVPWRQSRGVVRLTHHEASPLDDPSVLENVRHGGAHAMSIRAVCHGRCR